ncbi:DUF2214 domain-containing protein [Teredinibacter waterburyi]|jgi:Predicted membrane protein (DUF2214).|uniref:DUF2214 domain-containing protein n=1 Tax=Teredinibacter waterburyi TaxID=1500538 RepID=UPI00165F2031|nr:DUF2214 domain-containing protein [Teredinibacter waterburyi]
MKTLVVYMHLLSACVAVGSLILQDLGLWRTRARSLTENEIGELTKTAQVITLALVLLWISGLALVGLGYLANPEQYLLNEKLWAKFTVVVILTLNGVFLHYYTFPKISSGKVFISMQSTERFGVVLTGCISAVTWLFACYLGIARPWNYTLDYASIMTLYAGILAVAFVGGHEMVRFSGRSFANSMAQPS